MAIGQSTFGDMGGAVSDIFQGLGAKDAAAIKAKGLNLNASGLRLKAQGDETEAGNYDLAAQLAYKNRDYAEMSTNIQQTQLDRSIFKSLSATRADVAASGFAQSGSALDILSDSAAQGSLAKSVLAQQGLISEAGYREQGESYQNLAAAGRAAATGERSIADQTDQLAQDTIAAGDTQATGDFIAAGIKGIAALATLA